MSDQAAELHDDFGIDGQQLAPVQATNGKIGDENVDRARPVPRISIEGFVATNEVAQSLQAAADDRRLSKTHVSIRMGGVNAAIGQYQENPTSNLIIVESLGERNLLLSELDTLAEYCDEGTKVIVIGHVNDVILYRELMKRGVSEYLVAPVFPLDLLESISNLYSDPVADPVGKVYAFVGAKGGVGSSTICHNASWVLSKALAADVVIADLDLAFGTTGLDFNHDPVQGIAEALASPERLDEVLLERLLTNCSEHLSIFAAPVLLDQEYDLQAEACEAVVSAVRQNVPNVSLDLPHLWTGWAKQLLLQSDEVIITAMPDLPNLRNAKNLVDLLQDSRKNDHAPHLILNMTNVPKKPEISARDFEQALEIPVVAEVEFDPGTFGEASNKGQMIEELNSKAKAASQMREIAMTIAGREEARPEKKSSFEFLKQLSFMR